MEIISEDRNSKRKKSHDLEENVASDRTILVGKGSRPFVNVNTITIFKGHAASLSPLPELELYASELNKLGRGMKIRAKTKAEGEHGAALVRKRQSASVIAKKIKANGKATGSTSSIVREKLYKFKIRKETLRIKKMKTGLANLIKNKKVMAESLEAIKKDAANTEAEFRSLIKRKDGLMMELNTRISDFWALSEMETYLMMELGFL